jgi:hypothetical protein
LDLLGFFQQKKASTWEIKVQYKGKILPGAFVSWTPCRHALSGGITSKAFLNSLLDGSEWLASLRGHFIL